MNTKNTPFEDSEFVLIDIPQNNYLNRNNFYIGQYSICQIEYKNYKMPCFDYDFTVLDENSPNYKKEIRLTNFDNMYNIRNVMLNDRIPKSSNQYSKNFFNNFYYYIQKKIINNENIYLMFQYDDDTKYNINAVFLFIRNCSQLYLNNDIYNVNNLINDIFFGNNSENACNNGYLINLNSENNQDYVSIVPTDPINNNVDNTGSSLFDESTIPINMTQPYNPNTGVIVNPKQVIVAPIIEPRAIANPGPLIGVNPI